MCRSKLPASDPHTKKKTVLSEAPGLKREKNEAVLCVDVTGTSFSLCLRLFWHKKGLTEGPPPKKKKPTFFYCYKSTSEGLKEDKCHGFKIHNFTHLLSDKIKKEAAGVLGGDRKLST